MELTLIELVDTVGCDLVLTTGGTGAASPTAKCRSTGFLCVKTG
jgi:molybdopterin biosynthesis enzyme MoaB